MPEDFAQACLDAAAQYGTNAHLLIALADAETSLTNNTSPNGLYFGPYAISESEWKAVNVPAETGFGMKGASIQSLRRRSRRALSSNSRKRRNRICLKKRLPSSEELCLARVFGSKLLPVLLDQANQIKTCRDVLVPMPADEVDAIFARRPGLFTANITLKELRAAIEARLSTGFENAADLIGKIDPDLSVGPPQTAVTSATCPGW